MRLYGRQYTRREIEARAGRTDQLFGLRRVRLTDGPSDGTEHIEVRTGGGLTFVVSPHRGLDIPFAEYCGSPISWRCTNGDVHPAYYRAEEWWRTAVGGLLFTCGYRQVGTPCLDEGEELGPHGRAHQLPATEVSAWGEWHGDDYVMNICATIREVCFFNEKVEVQRYISARAGENRIYIEDNIRNAAFQPTPIMVLYHMNFGFPLVAEGTRFRFPSKTVEPREPETPLEGYDAWSPPDPDYAERVYFHSDIQTTADPELGEQTAEATIENDEFPVGGVNRPVRVSLKWDASTLPRLTQWKMAGAGEHVMGIEPANCMVAGRKAERERGTLVTLPPGETITTRLALEIS